MRDWARAAGPHTEHGALHGAERWLEIYAGHAHSARRADSRRPRRRARGAERDDGVMCP